MTKINSLDIQCKILDKPLPSKIFVSHRKLKAVQFSYKLKPIHNAPFKFVNKPMNVKYDLLIQDGKTIHSH